MNSPRHTALALCLAAASLVATAPASAQKGAAPVTVNFVNADIDAVSRAFGAMLNRQIVIDPRVKGQITVYSEQPQSIAQAYQSYLSALRGLGYAVVDSAGLLKVVPEADAKLQTGTVSVGEAPATRGDQVVTQIFQLKYENPNNLVAVLRPLISANNTINANPSSNALVITDYADNLKRLARIVAALDQPSSTDLEVVPLEHAVASDLAPLVQRLADGGGAVAAPGVPGAAGATTVLADPRSNSLIVRAANNAKLANVRVMIAQLDRPTSGLGPGGGLWVVHLKNADAVKLATVLRSAFGSTSGGTSGSGNRATTPTTPTPQANAANAAGGAASPQATAPVTPSGDITTGGFVQADPSTNSLIISAPEPLYRQVRGMIDQLDSRRAQVYIESMIVEVSGDDSADLGFQWQGLLGKAGDSTGLFAGTSLSVGGPSIITLSQTATGKGTTLPADGLNIGLIRKYGSSYALGAIANALATQAKTNIVSTPNLITLDNEEAKIVVGENVPFITGQYTNTGTATTSPFQTIERKDVGITLRVRPQIGEGGTVKMTIYQEQSAVESATAAGTSNAGPSTSKRSIESTVVVDDGQIIVLGGLIQDRYTENNSKVPLLGDIPYIGALFRSESRTKTRTNLMVFLRPIVMRDAESTQRLSLDRYDQIRGNQQKMQATPSLGVPVGEAPQLPAQPGGPGFEGAQSPRPAPSAPTSAPGSAAAPEAPPTAVASPVAPQRAP